MPIWYWVKGEEATGAVAVVGVLVGRVRQLAGLAEDLFDQPTVAAVLIH